MLLTLFNTLYFMGKTFLMLNRPITDGSDMWVRNSSSLRLTAQLEEETRLLLHLIFPLSQASLLGPFTPILISRIPSCPPWFFSQQPVDMPPELIYSTASATSHVNLFHMFILLCVKRGSTSSSLSLWPFNFRWWPQLLSPSHETWFFAPVNKRAAQKGSRVMTDMPALHQP